jgi:hypothetical protein
MYAAAASPRGVRGVSQAVAKEFVSADRGGKLPQHIADKNKQRIKKLYG